MRFSSALRCLLKLMRRQRVKNSPKADKNEIKKLKFSKLRLSNVLTTISDQQWIFKSLNVLLSGFQ